MLSTPATHTPVLPPRAPSTSSLLPPSCPSSELVLLLLRLLTTGKGRGGEGEGEREGGRRHPHSMCAVSTMHCRSVVTRCVCAPTTSYHQMHTQLTSVSDLTTLWRSLLTADGSSLLSSNFVTSCLSSIASSCFDGESWDKLIYTEIHIET